MGIWWYKTIKNFHMKTFEELKSEFIELLRDKSPCAPEYRKVLESTEQSELLAIIYNNLKWCVDAKCIPMSFLSEFDPVLFLESGIANTGKENSGVANSGDRNSGYSNSGNWNSGDRNSGDRNSGDWNSGDRNSGDSNSGNWNSGDSNSGNWNSGDRNSGDSNSGYRNSGAFCTDPNPKLILFDKESSMTVREWENHPACRLMNNINPNIWVWSSEMTEEEKQKFPSHETTGGFLKTIPYKEAWTNMWGNLTEENKNVLISLENFDKDKFKEITGISV